MADINILGVTTGKAVVGNNQRVPASGTRDGITYTMDWVNTKVLGGKLFTAQLGTLTTPVTFRVGVDADQPEMVIDVPNGTTIIPVHIGVYLEDAAGTDTEIIAQANPAVIGAGTSTTGTIVAKRLNGSFASACTFRYTYSGNGTAPASYDEFWREGDAFAQAAGTPKKKFDWNPTVSPPPVIVGPGALVLYIDGTGTAPAGYAKVTWAEELSTSL